MALDKNYGILYLSIGNPRPALVGINRPGNNYNSNSLIAIDLVKKKILWKFQEVSHDLWDYDIASPPVLTELKINDKILEVVIVTTKIGNVLIFERKSGKSLFLYKLLFFIYLSNITKNIYVKPVAHK